MREIYQEMQNADIKLGLFPPADKVKDPRNRYRKERLIADRWNTIRSVLGWKFIILADQIPLSWIIFDEKR
jgi:hypothetical protein